VRIELEAGDDGALQQARDRIAGVLKGYLLTLEWATPQGSPA
jgi:hypothetical protein